MDNREMFGVVKDYVINITKSLQGTALLNHVRSMLVANARYQLSIPLATTARRPQADNCIRCCDKGFSSIL